MNTHQHHEQEHHEHDEHHAHDEHHGHDEHDGHDGHDGHVEHHGHDGHQGHGGHGGHHGHGAPQGLTASDQGYTLIPETVGPEGEFTFRITGPDGKPVTGYEPQHEALLHLIVVRHDLSGYRHVHPELDADGTWRVAGPFDGPAAYHAYADFKAVGAAPLTLGVDLTLPGETTGRPLPEASATATVDGYTVTLTGELAAGNGAPLTFTVTRDGAPVTDLQPYLAAYGHLVALRAADLAYLHVHPDGEPGDGTTAPGPDITFHAVAPTAGPYRLYLDFKHGDAVHTAEFTAVAGA
ncbi:hypothetical protein [Streptomyces sp. CBMA123]|uniref:hypothetical protein n=1 Tax=Streptomyces sp. CBMA123 TaxID=1896313 RepID=UPI001661BDB6|nr:hypothetical protein [Streptomyces sp. CBMA123]